MDNNQLNDLFKEGLGSFEPETPMNGFNHLKHKIEEANTVTDNLFKNELGQFNVAPPLRVWNNLESDLAQFNKAQGRYSPIDDIFHETLSSNSTSPSTNVWQRLSSDLGNEYEFEMAHTLNAANPQPPSWVWRSLNFLLTSERKNKQRKRFVLLFLGMLGSAFTGWLVYNQQGNEPTKSISEKQLPTAPAQSDVADVISPSRKIARTQQINSSSLLHNSPQGIVAHNQLAPTKSAGDGNNNVQAANTARSIIVTGNEVNADEHVVADNTTFAKQEEYSEIDEQQVSIHPKLLMLQNVAPELLAEAPVIIKKPVFKRHLPIDISYLTSFEHSFRVLSGSDEASMIRKNSEKDLATQSHSLRIGIPLSKNWVFSTGITLAERGEKANYSFNQLHFLNNIYFTDIDSTKNPMQYRKVTTRDDRPDTTWVNHQGVNSYKYVELPIRLGYRFKVKGIQFTPTAGIHVGYLYQTSGSIVIAGQDNPQLVPISEVGHHRFNLNTQLAFNIGLPLTRHVSFSAEPFATYSVNSTFKGGESARQYFYSKGIQLGLTYHF
jgi:hypothetical protein